MISDYVHYYLQINGHTIACDNDVETAQYHYFELRDALSGIPCKLQIYSKNNCLVSNVLIIK